MAPAGRYDEDLEGNLRLVEQLAPRHCVACGGYHLSRARKRVDPGHVEMLDRPRIVELVRRHAAARLTATPATVDLLIAGNADTNLLSTCAEAVSSLDAASLRRLRYTAIDRCQTPLALCHAYAARCGLDLRTALADIAVTPLNLSVDLVLLHSLLRFAPVDSHVAILRRLLTWLRPGGVIIFSHRLMPVRTMPDDTDASYVAEYQTTRQLRALFDESGFRILSIREMDEDDARRRKRILAVLAPGV